MQNNTNSENHTTSVAAKPLATQTLSYKKYSTVYKNNFQWTILHHFPQLPCMWTSEPLRVSVAWLNIVNEERETDRMTLREKERLPCAWWGLHNNSACQERVNHTPCPHKHDRIKYLKAKAALHASVSSYDTCLMKPPEHTDSPKDDHKRTFWRGWRYPDALSPAPRPCLNMQRQLCEETALLHVRYGTKTFREQFMQIPPAPKSTALHFLYIFQ